MPTGFLAFCTLASLSMRELAHFAATAVASFPGIYVTGSPPTVERWHRSGTVRANQREAASPCLTT
jgi:hypothetical protein